MQSDFKVFETKDKIYLKNQYITVPNKLQFYIADKPFDRLTVQIYCIKSFSYISNNVTGYIYLAT